LKKLSNLVLGNISDELNPAVSLALLLYRLKITFGLGMIGSRNHQFYVRQALTNFSESLNHGFQSFVSAPFSECEYSLNRIAPPFECRVFGPARKNAMLAYINRSAAILVSDQGAVRG
jgi:hypothetical protein